MPRPDRRVVFALAAALLAGLVPAARAQGTPSALPDRALRLIVPSSAGSGADTAARAMAARLGEIVRQPVVVENLPSGGGTVGITTAARARRDGATLLAAISGLLLGPMMDSTLPYDLFRDFVPVSQMMAATGALVVTRAVTAATVQDFIAQAKGGASFNLGNYGYGSASHLQSELFNRRAGIELQTVPYSGSSLLIRDMLAGHVCCAFLDTGSAAAYFQPGTLRALAVTGPRRSPLLPDVPTFVELGFAGFEPQIWQGVFLPAGTPEPVVAAMGRAVAEALRHPDVARTIRELGFEPIGSTPEAFAAMLRQDAPVWRRVVDETGIRVR
jgi:tripartite-type tricarboxylate transporter receptor subunit TctC